ncbi:MAG: 4Fe-4S dicluster domain-containing protein [Candidatus Omnitrophica bacterium]|nr:4Fe-4S dicluster domain-containing protein [Candidatus Omnitrophota bacterium]
MEARYRKTLLLKDTGALDRTKEFFNLFLERLREEGLQEEVQVVRAGDLGMYGYGLVVKILPDEYTYVNVEAKDVPKIVQTSLKKSNPVQDLLYTPREKQMRVVLKNCGEVDPESVDDYILHGGYGALKKVLTEFTPEQVIDELKTSGLRGRGGGGFPTWMKWNFARKVEAAEKYIICNGDEGDPGAYMDRSVLEGDPHAVLEGMIIAGYTVGASKGFLYIRAEYPLAIERIQRAIAQAQDYGLLGGNILGTEFQFDLEIRLGAGAFVCGEETALIASVEGKRGYPSPRPPYPSVKGLWGMPTVINNVETLANIPVIFDRGGAWFSGIGSQTAKGTKVFALTGKVKNSGLIEVPMGITLREIVYEIGGGLSEGKKLKAVQTGGPSGGVIPDKFLDTPVDYEHLMELGSIMGSGGMIVIDEEDCMVDIAKFYLNFCVDEACGKCSPGRIGTFQMRNYLQKISSGQAGEDDLDKLEAICRATKKAALCGLGQTAPNPTLSTLRFFREEYLEHIRERRCRAGKCIDLLRYKIKQEKCKRCGVCAMHCPVNAISGSREEGYRIDVEKCVKCGQCFEVCKFDAVTRE